MLKGPAAAVHRRQPYAQSPDHLLVRDRCKNDCFASQFPDILSSLRFSLMLESIGDFRVSTPKYHHSHATQSASSCRKIAWRLSEAGKTCPKRSTAPLSLQSRRQSPTLLLTPRANLKTKRLKYKYNTLRIQQFGWVTYWRLFLDPVDSRMRRKA